MSLVVVGAGGHAREVLDVAEACGESIAGVVDEGTPDIQKLDRRGIVFLGHLDQISADDTVVLGIGDSGARGHLVARLAGMVTWHPALVHPAATLGSAVVLGEGCVVAAGARLTTAITVGAHGYVGPNATIGHDTVLDDCVTVLPGATVSGSVHLGAGTSVGTGANLRQGIRLGSGVTVGAGAVVLDDVEAGATVAGVPARPLR